LSGASAAVHDVQADRIPPAWTAAWREHHAKLTQSRLFIAALLVAVVIALDASFQYVFRPATFAAIFWVRVTVVAIAGLVSLAARPRWAKYASWLAIILFVALASDIEAAVIHSGGPASPFQGALGLLVVAAGLVLPLELVTIAPLIAMIWGIWLVPIATAHSRVVWAGFEVYVLLMICATLIALIASWLTGRLRRSEFFGRQALAEERERSERLLLNILPAPIAARLKAGEKTIADELKQVTVLFADIVGFTTLAARLPAGRVVALLDEVFSTFDALAARYRLEKIKTIGDAYMVASGVPEQRPDHAPAAADCALAMLAAIPALCDKLGTAIKLRIGLHSGAAVAGVIGKQKFSFDLWGDTVNTASRMESHGIPGRIHVSADTARHLENDFELEARGSIEVKGKGPMQTFFLIRRQPVSSDS
jgi:class 3 adenylate cyclase